MTRSTEGATGPLWSRLAITSRVIVNYCKRASSKAFSGGSNRSVTTRASMVPSPGSECAFQCIDRQEWRLSERPSNRKPEHSGANAYLLGSVDTPQGFTELALDIVALPLDTLNSPAKNESTDDNLVGRLALQSEWRQVVRPASLACQGDTRRILFFLAGRSASVSRQELR